MAMATVEYCRYLVQLDLHPPIRPSLDPLRNCFTASAATTWGRKAGVESTSWALVSPGEHQNMAPKIQIILNGCSST